MTELIKVSPAEGRRVRDPDTMKLIGPGYEVNPEEVYWHRRIRDADVTVDKDADKPGKPPPDKPVSDGAAPDGQKGAEAKSDTAVTGATSAKGASQPTDTGTR